MESLAASAELRETAAAAELTTVSSSPFRSCLACSLLSCITLQKPHETCQSAAVGTGSRGRRPRGTYVSSCSLRLFSWSVDLSFSCSTRSLSCSSMIFWFRLEEEQHRDGHQFMTSSRRGFLLSFQPYSCRSVISFSLLSSSSLRLLICFW